MLLTALAGHADATTLRASLQAMEPAPVEVRETHGSIVLLTASHAYKLKRAVEFDFADLRSLQARRRACLAELEANREFGNDHVLDVRAVVPAGSGYRLEPRDADGAIDYVVVMRRFDEGDTLAARIRGGRLERHHVREAAQALALQHGQARRVHDAPTAHELADRNFEGLVEVAQDRLDRGQLLAAQRFANAFLLAWDSTLEARARTGCVIDGHGDVRAEHLLVPDGGTATLVDRLEHRHLRTIDVADELAFLRMDLTRLGAGDLWPWFLQDYVEAGGERPPGRLLAYFAAHRALVATKVTLVRAGQTGDAKLSSDARDLMLCASRFAADARGPLTVLVTGPPASGKSTLAAALSESTGRPILSSDRCRAQIAPAYDDASRRAVYATLGSDARRHVEGCIVDATFGDPAHRQAFLDAYGRLAPIVVVHCDAPDGERVARAAARVEDPYGSGADADVAARLGKAFTPFDGVPVGDVLPVNGLAAPAESVDVVLAWLDRRLAEDRC